MSSHTDYTLINKLSVSIASHKVQLSKAESTDEIDRILRSIMDMETEILIEKKKDLKEKYSKKEDILQKIASLESQLDDVNREINSSLGVLRDAVARRIARLETDVNNKTLSSSSPEMESPSLD